MSAELIPKGLATRNEFGSLYFHVFEIFEFMTGSETVQAIHLFDIWCPVVDCLLRASPFRQDTAL